MKTVWSIFDGDFAGLGLSDLGCTWREAEEETEQSESFLCCFPYDDQLIYIHHQIYND